jgi:predicted TIM-barrel fold metal-dependent hydrolase
MISNDEVAGFVAEARGRLIGVGSVDIAKPMAAVREIRRCVQELGFKAIRVLPWLWEVPPTDRHGCPRAASARRRLGPVPSSPMLQTRAEATEYRQTSLHADVMAFIAGLATPAMGAEFPACRVR